MEKFGLNNSLFQPLDGATAQTHKRTSELDASIKPRQPKMDSLISLCLMFNGQYLFGPYDSVKMYIHNPPPLTCTAGPMM